MINIETFKDSLKNTNISNLIFDPSILFISEDVLADSEQCERIIQWLIKFFNIIDEYNLKLYWNHDLQQLFYQKYFHIISGYRPQILASFLQKFFPKLILINTEGYNKCNILPNIEFRSELTECYSHFKILIHFLIHNKSEIGYFLSVFQNREDYVFRCIDCEELMVLNPYSIKKERDLFSFLYNYFLNENFPLKDDDIFIKIQKIRLIINLELFIIKNFCDIHRNYEFKVDFWNSDFLYTEDLKFRRKVFEVICTILLNPKTKSFRKHRLRNQYIKINGIKKPIMQYDIFQEYRLYGVKITPRLLVSFFQNKIVFYKIIDRH